MVRTNPKANQRRRKNSGSSDTLSHKMHTLTVYTHFDMSRIFRCPATKVQIMVMPTAISDDPRYANRILEISEPDDIPKEWRDTPIEKFIASENFH